jgi:ribonuclease J
MTNPLLKIRPVGGVGQIGSNMTLVEHNDTCLLIDAGILFPYEDFFDIDYLIPNLDLIPEPQTLIITHGHEDHIGAVYNVILKFPNIKIYAPRFAAALIRKKLEFNKHPYPVTVITPSETLIFGDLNLNYIAVNHSIPDTFGLYVSLEKNSLGFLFVSDFKIDFKTKYEPVFDFEKLKRLSAKHNKKILFADSTNITSNTLETPSEMDLIPSFEKIFSEVSGRIFITLFSSNVHRVKTIIDMAEKYQYHVIPYGRSMISYLNSAIEENIIPANEKVIKSADSIKKDTENVVVLLSGCQGDFLGTFRRVSMGEDSVFKVKPSDTFVISSKAIPGNEKKINLLLNKISTLGCKIYSPSDLLIHVSGHPGKKDLEYLYNEFKPTDIVPIHGEVHFLREHIAHVKEVFPQAIPHFFLNNDELHLGNDLKIKIIQGEKSEPIIYHGKHIVLEKEKISERRKLACNGAVFLTLKLDFKSTCTSIDYNLLGIPKIIFDNEAHFKDFLNAEIAKYNFKDVEKAKEEIKNSIRRYFDFKLGYKPTTIVHIL